MTTPPGRPFPQQPGDHDQTQVGRPQPSAQAYSQWPEGQSAYGQTPYSHNPYGQALYGGPQHGQPAYPTPGVPTPGDNRSMKVVIVIVSVLTVAAIAGLIALFAFSGDGAETTTTSASVSATTSAGRAATGASPAVGTCLSVRGSTSVTTVSADCDSTGRLTYIIGATVASSDACDDAHYQFSVIESDDGGRTLCLIPNYQVGRCYSLPHSVVGIDLTTSSCSRGSTDSVAIFRVTERTSSGSVPNCSGSDRLRASTYEIRTSPMQQVSVCQEILGDYVWR
ncbi:hypothetical protein nbrc107696_36700 [Gordonia spumicola]|uniref:Uncharacterized protein n=1 Tax=Gordonia spumicola TaxID=589161 RepID=A0A7I9VD49_9ACTN|nr:hypothetical protein [Gordonia spumicola]GEE03224.1 hypothetical protein nbrc107696_36700 [Gordonia spumicola]